jgi:flagellar L-ring protein precursor FlgH
MNQRIVKVCLVMSVAGCAAPAPMSVRRPAEVYANMVRGTADEDPRGGMPSRGDSRPVGSRSTSNAPEGTPRARLGFTGESTNPEVRYAADGGVEPDFYVERSPLAGKREYAGPLSLGDPGVSASLWRESRGGNNLFYDYRAWQPMDLITIVVSEDAEGTKEADTEVKSKTSIELAIEKFLGFETNFTDIDPGSLIKADSKNDFKGEGETTRKDSLTARISAMVAEVLPSGVLRIEGEKIISVNNEEQIMVISGLVRPRDVNSDNEVASNKVANMRIDYYGRGTVGEAQYGGWLGRGLRKIWPF